MKTIRTLIGYETNGTYVKYFDIYWYVDTENDRNPFDTEPEADDFIKENCQPKEVTDDEIETECGEVDAPLDEYGRSIFKYAYDEDQQEAFIDGAKWMRERLTNKQ